MTADELLDEAWRDHAELTDDIARRIGSSFDLIESPEHVQAFVALLVHVYGEHLGDWQRGAELLQTMKELGAASGSAAANSSIDRGMATLRYAGGDGHALEALAVEDRVRALATASSALAGRDDSARAIAFLREALRLGEGALPAASPAMRALAAAGNNLAAALECKVDRTAFETEAMVDAAEAALKCWKQAGTWLEEERAEYRLARSLLQAGEPVAAVECAERCLRVCEQHDAPPFERFFAHAALALAHRAAGDAARSRVHRQAAADQYEKVAPAEREFCASDLAELAD